MRAATRSITIACPPDRVFQFVADPANLPQWSQSFYLGIALEQGQWVAQTPTGPVQVRIATHRQLRIADQFIALAPGVEMMIPMRVVPNEQGSEFILTLFQPEYISETDYQAEVQLIEHELRLLKQILESLT